MSAAQRAPQPLHLSLGGLGLQPSSSTSNRDSTCSSEPSTTPCANCSCILGEQHNASNDADVPSSVVSTSTLSESPSIASLCQDESCPNRRRRQHLDATVAALSTPADHQLSATSTLISSTSRRTSVSQQFARASEVPNTPCGACPFCPDTCRQASCATCSAKEDALAQSTEGRRQKGCKKQLFTMCQVKRHNTADSCWLVANKIVYDVTEFLTLSHPGGTATILRKGGTDVSRDYKFHSAKTKSLLWKRFAIGVLVKCPGETTQEDDKKGWYQRVFNW
eukprot:m.27065 g.27065  ORF g.27065 m.27065 type:complete len:279 (-) comp11746_c0_seq1:82-918(-)